MYQQDEGTWQTLQKIDKLKALQLVTSDEDALAATYTKPLS